MRCSQTTYASVERYPRTIGVGFGGLALQHFGELDTIMPPACKFITFGGTPHWPMIRATVPGDGGGQL
jgi:hypothetical protein